MSENPLVSLIVPMYNVGSFAAPCVRSLLSQTYKNLEILIIDDGSTDDTIDICKTEIGSDSRARVLNKSNGGLSSARNFGTRCCSGDFVMYVDGDDMLDARAVEVMVTAAIENEVDVVTAGFAKVPACPDYAMEGKTFFSIVSGEEKLRELLLLDGESGSAWGKLYSRSLLDYLEYPEGQLFEDMGVTATVFSHLNRVAESRSPLYAYVTRPNSITTQISQGPRHARDMEKTIRRVEGQVATNPRLEEAFYCFEAFCTLRVAMRLSENKFDDPREFEAYIKHARKLSGRAARSPLASKTWRGRCLLYSVSPALHNALYALYGFLTGKVIG